MFNIWGIKEEGIPYSPGDIHWQRRVDPVDKTRSIFKVGSHAQEPRTTKDSQPPLGRKLLEIFHHQDQQGQNREPAILARQIMSTPLVTLLQTANLSETAKLFQNRRFRHVPVISENGQLVGLISDRDVWREMVKTSTQQDLADDEVILPAIQDMMSTPVLTAHPDTEIRVIASVLFEERIGAMPIVDGSQLPVGILTRSDILRTVMRHTPFELWI